MQFEIETKENDENRGFHAWVTQELEHQASVLPMEVSKERLEYAAISTDIRKKVEQVRGRSIQR